MTDADSEKTRFFWCKNYSMDTEKSLQEFKKFQTPSFLPAFKAMQTAINDK